MAPPPCKRCRCDAECAGRERSESEEAAGLMLAGLLESMVMRDLAGHIAEYLAAPTTCSHFWRFPKQTMLPVTPLLQCSSTLLNSFILGLKERRATIEHGKKLGFNLLCDAVREGFRPRWARLRSLQQSKTDVEDLVACCELVSLLTSARVVMVR
eukprot:TRINITY_DN44610_c0_g1_i1.p2 TRINITY_DN44610_c0_g1~~TRINITY_DN44610_c0_g1_i1.p2  ORF type:complete len:172 (-),score=37.50 TRINITY_DN44610_c0_g1_i1:187-651(-)